MRLKLLLSLLVPVVVCSCASSPYKVSLSAGEALYGKTVVLLEIGSAKQKLVYIPLVDAAIYNSALGENAEQLKAAQEEGNRDLYDGIAEYFSSGYNAVLVKSAYPFEG